MLEDKEIVSKAIIYKVRCTIKSKFPKLNDMDTMLLVNEAIEAYNEYKSEIPNLKIITTNFLIYYMYKKVENNLSKQDLVLLLKENENVFTTGNGRTRKTMRQKEKEEIKKERESNQNFGKIVKKSILAKELDIDEYAFRSKSLHLIKKFPNIPKEILLKATCDYYYIKKHNNKLLALLPKIGNSYRDNLILEIVILRMEQVLTYEEAYEIAVKNLENGTSLLYLKYGDETEEKTRDIYSKK